MWHQSLGHKHSYIESLVFQNIYSGEASWYVWIQLSYPCDKLKLATWRSDRETQLCKWSKRNEVTMGVQHYLVYRWLQLRHSLIVTSWESLRENPWESIDSQTMRKTTYCCFKPQSGRWFVMQKLTIILTVYISSACKYCSYFYKNWIINIHCNQTILSSNYDSATSRHCSFVEITQLLKKCIFHLKNGRGSSSSQRNWKT